MKNDIMHIKRRTLIFLSYRTLRSKFNLKKFILSQMRYNNILAVIGHKSDNMTVSLCTYLKIYFSV